jgi:glycosyltransferase involved in cell wall biosynthesis
LIETTIIIPLFNSQQFIGETINSVKAQTFTDWECIIIDDHSTDDSLEIAKSLTLNDPRFKVFRRDREPKNASVCRNIGLNLSKGNFILFLDSDDLLAPFCLEQRISTMRNANLDFGIFLMQKFLLHPGDHNVLQNRTLNSKTGTYLDMLIRFQIPWQTSCVFWTRTFLVELNGFDESFIRLQDPEISVRALARSNKFKVYDQLPIDCYYRQSDTLKKVENYPKYFFHYMKKNWVALSKTIEDHKSDFLQSLLFTYFHAVKQINDPEQKKLLNDIRKWGKENSLLTKKLIVQLRIIGLLSKIAQTISYRLWIRVYNLFFKRIYKLQLTR